MSILHRAAKNSGLPVTICSGNGNPVVIWLSLEEEAAVPGEIGVHRVIRQWERLHQKRAPHLARANPQSNLEEALLAVNGLHVTIFLIAKNL